MISTWTVAKKVSATVAVGLFSLLLIGTLSHRNSKKLINSAGWVTHTHEVLETNTQILSLLKGAETGQRGYLITGESRYLEPYNNAKNSIAVTIRKLGELTSDNPVQQQRISQLDGLVDDKSPSSKKPLTCGRAGALRMQGEWS
jgi:methyl-accepting chemotaxis protein